MIGIEWVGGWLDFDLIGPWGAAPRVYVLLVGPLYVSIWPRALADRMREERSFL